MQVLRNVEIAPPFFEQGSEDAHPGYLVPDLTAALNRILAMGLQQPTLTDLLTLTSVQPPPGFGVAVRYAASQARLWSLPPASLQLRSCDGSPLPMERCSIVAAGQHSLVLRLGPEAPFVVKVSSTGTIQRELELHVLADAAGCPHLRSAYRNSAGSSPLSGTVHGAGEGLGFVALSGFFVSSLQHEHAGTPHLFARTALQVQAVVCHEQD